MSEYSLFTSESVSEGHPDKMSDQISDAILDTYLSKDADARVAVETLVKTGMVVVAGEVTTSGTVTTVLPCPRLIMRTQFADNQAASGGEQRGRFTDDLLGCEVWWSTMLAITTSALCPASTSADVLPQMKSMLLRWPA